MVTINDDVGQTMIIGVSGGPDSMALLDQMVQSKHTLIVCHMNYHHRDSADRDQTIVQSYCLDHGIVCIVEDYKHGRSTNFQADARNQRYTFFKRWYDHYHASCLLIAHNLDDHIETYLMQKDSGRQVDYYGLMFQRYLYGMKVVRPLLSIRKKTLLAYCNDHHIPYGIDESNLSDDYQRNKIRHHRVETMDDTNIDALVKSIDALNTIKKETYQHYRSLIDNAGLTITDINTTPLLWLRWYIREYTIDTNNHKDAYYQQIKDDLARRGWTKYDHGSLEYDRQHIMYHPRLSFDPILLYDLDHNDHGVFKLCSKGTIRQGINAFQDDFPLTVRLVKPGDTMAFKFGHKSLHRYFIDHKIPLHQRYNTLVVINQHGTIIFASGIGCDLSHYTDTFDTFMVQSSS